MALSNNGTSRVVLLCKRLYRSVWLFPAVLAVPLVLFSALSISGSSIGVYHDIFYGETVKDHSLLAGSPRPIRSDEWLVNTPMTLAQKNNDFQRINENIGHGEDTSLVIDAPYKEWSTVFKPHQLAFFIMPFDNAFAFRWWVMAYALILSAYFFVLTLLPNRKLLASLIGLGLFFSPFIQWWYLYGTLGTLTYSLFAATFIVKILNEKRRLQSIMWGALLTYTITCMALLLYPPFQIACGIVVAAFSLGWLLESRQTTSSKQMLRKVMLIGGSVVLASLITAIFLYTRSQVVSTIQNTSYPGHRTQASGNYDAYHLFSGHLGAQLQIEDRAQHYRIPESGLNNNSENSGFLLLIPFTLLPSFYLLFIYYRHKKKIDWPLLLINLTFISFVGWLVVPGIDQIGKVTLLQLVPHQRLIIGLGLLNILQLVLLIRRYTSFKTKALDNKYIIAYCGMVFAVGVYLGHYAMVRTPGFIGIYRVVAFALPITVIIFLILKQRFVMAAAVFALFSAYMVIHVNPLYRGTSVLTSTPLSAKIRYLAAKDNSRWASEVFVLENLVVLNGARSLNGVYSYPQPDIWESADPKASRSVYNRYAHTIFAFDRDPSQTTATKLSQGGGDSFGILTEPCSPFLEKEQVRFLIAGSALDSSARCATLIQKITYPTQSFYIYKLKF